MLIYDIVVGDILLLNQGDIVPVDGVLITTQLIKMNEASMTGETTMISKTT